MLPVAVVGWSLDLVGRLIAAYPETVVGLKDSSGDWNNTSAMIQQFAPAGFRVFVGSERFLLANLRAGGVGCITATANVNPAAIDRLYREWRSPGAEGLQERVNAVRGAVERRPVIPALKAIVARHSGDTLWRTVRPPLADLPAADVDLLFAELDRLSFSMPGLLG